jgi:hypothetical protein
MEKSGKRRFPPPWKVLPIAGGFTVQDTHGTVLCYIYSDNNKMASASSYALEKLSVEEAFLLARWIARLPELISGRQKKSRAIPIE